jgi:hypothetical protein
MSTSPSETVAPSASVIVNSRVRVDSGKCTRVPLSTTSGMFAGLRRKRAASSGWSVNPPSRVMPIGMTVYFERSIAESTPPAVAQLIVCSDERPPKSRATVSIYSPWGRSSVVRCGAMSRGSSVPASTSATWLTIGICTCLASASSRIGATEARPSAVWFICLTTSA